MACFKWITPYIGGYNKRSLFLCRSCPLVPVVSTLRTFFIIPSFPTFAPFTNTRSRTPSPPTPPHPPSLPLPPPPLPTITTTTTHKTTRRRFLFRAIPVLHRSSHGPTRRQNYCQRHRRRVDATLRGYHGVPSCASVALLLQLLLLLLLLFIIIIIRTVINSIPPFAKARARRPLIGLTRATS